MAGVAASLCLHALGFALLGVAGDWGAVRRPHSPGAVLQFPELPSFDSVEVQPPVDALEPLDPEEFALDEPTLREPPSAARPLELAPVPLFAPLDAAVLADPLALRPFRDLRARPAAASAAASAASNGGEAALGSAAGEAQDSAEGSASAPREFIAARALETPRPDYPRASVALGEEGTVQCRLFVDAFGAVRDVQVLASSGHARLDEAARKRLLAWRFEAARLDGQATESTIDMPVIFRLSDA